MKALVVLGGTCILISVMIIINTSNVDISRPLYIMLPPYTFDLTVLVVDITISCLSRPARLISISIPSTSMALLRTTFALSTAYFSCQESH